MIDYSWPCRGQPELGCAMMSECVPPSQSIWLDPICVFIFSGWTVRERSEAQEIDDADH